jgi:hypothetical protein
MRRLLPTSRAAAVLAAVVSTAALLTAAARPAVAQTAAPPAASAAKGRLRGLVIDSLSDRVLPGAFVQVVGDSPSTFIGTATADAFGEYVIANIPAGRYTIGFQHPLLDSLGIEAPVRVAQLRDSGEVRVDLAVPSPERLRRTLCAAAPGALIMGFVRDVRTNTAVESANVTAEWLEYALGRTGLTTSRPKRVSTSFPSGFYALCQMPAPGVVVLRAGKGADSTGAVEVALTARAFFRQDLIVGAAADGRIAGAVRTRDGAPLVGAQVAMLDGPSTRTNERGEWSLTGAPAGTRSLEVRAVGFYPDRRTLTVSASTPRVDTRLETLKAVLDTMKVVANLPPSIVAEFNTRRRTLPGRFLAPEDIARRGPTQVSDLFKSIPGVYLEVLMPSDTLNQFAGSTGDTGDGQLRITMRGGFSAKCIPSIWLNNLQLQDVAAADLDGLMQPNDLIGVEVYQPTQVPAQFRVGMTGCGAVVFWRRR